MNSNKRNVRFQTRDYLAVCRSFPKKVVERHFGLDVVPIRISANAVHRYHGKVNGIGRVGLLYESLATGLKMQIILLVDGELSLAVLSFVCDSCEYGK